MSGAAGGSRIKKEDLKATIRDYRDNVLKPLGLDVSYSITGVRSRPEKNVFGDIDIVVSFPEGDKKELKQQLANFLTQNDRIPIIPSKNKKYFIHGNIVSALYPIAGKDGEYVQIDNIVTVSKEEGKFAYKMLDLPAQEQTLAIGLSKAIFTELDEKQIENLFKDLGITNVEKPGEGEEYDFNLNPSELTLRIVPIGKNDGKLIWKSSKFEDVKKLTSALGIDIEKDKFDDIVPKIKKFKNRRSIDRLKGMFAKNIRVGDAEKEIEKGIKKQQALDTIASLEEKYNPLVVDLIKSIITEEETKETIAVFPGKFKPPHKDHIARIITASKDANKVIVLVSPLSSKRKSDEPDQEIITADQSLAVFKAVTLPENVTVIVANDLSKLSKQFPNLKWVSNNSPVRVARDLFTNNPEQQFIGVFGKGEDFERYGGVPQNVIIKNYDEAAGDLSATNLRIALKNNGDITPFLPNGISSEKYKETLGINNINEDCGCQHSQPTDFKSALASLTKYMVDQGLNVAPLPKVKIINNDAENAENILGRTAHYDPNNCSITLYTLNRHPKDVLRSFSHEMIHRIQDNEGRLNNVNTTNTNEDSNLQELEKEAYLNGNIIFRNWEDSVKNV